MPRAAWEMAQRKARGTGVLPPDLSTKRWWTCDKQQAIFSWLRLLSRDNHPRSFERSAPSVGRPKSCLIKDPREAGQELDFKMFDFRIQSKWHHQFLAYDASCKGDRRCDSWVYRSNDVKWWNNGVIQELKQVSGGASRHSRRNCGNSANREHNHQLLALECWWPLLMLW